jgi:predicted nuclease of predicted toxin-antitoxin system
VTFLLDENLSFRLKRLLAPTFPGIRHVSDLKLLSADDAEVMDAARREGLVLLSKDDDFLERVQASRHPVRLVWVRLGNVTTIEIADALIDRQQALRAWLASGADKVFEVAPKS